MDIYSAQTPLNQAILTSRTQFEPQPTDFSPGPLFQLCERPPFSM